MVKKKIAVFLTAVVVALIVVSPISAYASEVKEDKKCTYTAKEIKDKDVLMQRAKEGIDEFKANTGYEIKVTTDASAGISAETYQTSQLISTTETNGAVQEEYAITILTAYNTTDTVSKYGYTLQTTIHARWDDNTGATLIFDYSDSYIYGSGTPALRSIAMRNEVYTGWDTMQTYDNSDAFPAQVGMSRILQSPYKNGIYETGSYIKASDILYFQDGTSCTTAAMLMPYL